MGAQSSKVSYLAILPKELKCQLLSYMTDIRDISTVQTIDYLNFLVHSCIRHIDYGSKGYGNDVQDVIMSVDAFSPLFFRSVTICQVPIVADDSNELPNLGKDSALREFVVTIPKGEIINSPAKVLDNIAEMFYNFIQRRKSILDMKISIEQQHKFMPYNIPPFFPLSKKFLKPPILSFDYRALADSFSATQLTFSRGPYIRPFTLLYLNGNLLIDQYLTQLPAYQNFLKLLHDSGNLNAVTFMNPVPPLSTLDYLPLIETVYIVSAAYAAMNEAFKAFLRDQHITKLQLKNKLGYPNYVDKTDEKLYGYYLEFSRYVITTMQQYVARNASVQLIYPFAIDVIDTVTQAIPNLNELGFYDNFKTLDELSAFIVNLLETIDVVHIFTVKPHNTYNSLLRQYPNRIIIEEN